VGAEEAECRDCDHPPEYRAPSALTDLMTFSHRQVTYVRLGAVEAYARLKRRVMAIADSAVVFTVQAAEPAAVPETLFALKEGDLLSPHDFESIIPGLSETPSTFSPATAERAVHTLTAVTDDIAVVFELPCAEESDIARAEAKLRGAQARFVITMLWPPGREADTDA